jgi:hypothetical protein
MSSQEIVSYTHSSLALSPLSLGLSAVFGPQYSSSGSSIASDVLSRLLFMILERMLRSVETFASRFLDSLTTPKKELESPTAAIVEEVKTLKEMNTKPKVTEAIIGVYLTY